jgi:hypothetical protein
MASDWACTLSSNDKPIEVRKKAAESFMFTELEGLIASIMGSHDLLQIVIFALWGMKLIEEMA